MALIPSLAILLAISHHLNGSQYVLMLLMLLMRAGWNFLSKDIFEGRAFWTMLTTIA